MTTPATYLPPLLGPDEPSAVQVHRAHGRSAFFLICDHAGKRLPQALGNLGLPDTELNRHIAWDIGAAALAAKIADRLDATLISQTYSRLAIDCNRPFASPTSIPPVSEAITIPGNQAISAQDAQRRQRDIFAPYHDRIVAELEARAAAGRPTILVAVHSFTKDFADQPSRPWHVGILYNRDARLARILLDLLRAETGLVVGDNQPYAVDDNSDYAIPVYGEQRGLPHVELEIRQDLLADEPGQEAWARRLVNVLRRAELMLTPTR